MRVLTPLLGIALSFAAWAALVILAVVAGTSRSWGSLAVFAVAAAACLFLGLLSFARFRAVRRGQLPVRRTPSHRA
jgi:hypothetical protein